MKPTTLYSISIAAPGAKDPATRLRKQFNSLVKKTEAARALLAAWKETLPAVAARAERELQPLMLDYLRHQRDMLVLLDGMHPKLKGKRDRTKVSDFICTLAEELLGEDDDAEIQAIYERHGGDAEEDEDDDDDEFMLMLAALDAENEDTRGTPSPDDDLFAVFGAHENDDDGTAKARSSAGKASHPPRRKTAAALAREEREAAEAARLKQPVRDIYRRLASELHPDREPDNTERARKTALMQRVTVAYKANDLLALLELQLEIAQIGQSDLDSLAEGHIKLYNKLLEAQLREIETELAQYEYQAFMSTGGRMHARPTPQALSRSLDADITELRKQVQEIAANLEAFRDVNALKAWLKTWKPARRSPYDDDGFWF